MTSFTIQPPNTSLRPLGQEHLRMFRRMTQERDVVPNVALPKEAWPKELPKPASESTFTTCGVEYRILRYKEQKGPSLKQTKRIAKCMGLRMLTRKETEAILENKESSTTFLDVLNFKEKAYVSDTKLEKRSHAVYLYHHTNDKLYIIDSHWPDEAAQVVILKEK